MSPYTFQVAPPHNVLQNKLILDMKKIILSLAVLTMAVACNKDHVVDQRTPEAIRFGNVFVEKATRAAYDFSYNLQKLTAFEVYGTITNKDNQVANIFFQENVQRSQEKEGFVWKYSSTNTQYWIPGNTYDFTAIADGNVESVTEVTVDGNKMPVTIVLSDASAQKDILYADSKGITYVSGEKTVDFTFSHIMSKAKFTVKNDIATNNGYYYKVKDVKITNAAKVATYTIGTGWGAATGSYELMFGDIVDDSKGDDGELMTPPAADIRYKQYFESNFERLLIPTNIAAGSKTTVNVEFVCELYKDDVLIQTTKKELSTETVFKAGHAYNFSIALGNPGSPIKFSVYQVNGWDEDVNDDNSVNADDDVVLQ